MASGKIFIRRMDCVPNGMAKDDIRAYGFVFEGKNVLMDGGGQGFSLPHSRPALAKSLARRYNRMDASQQNYEAAK